MFAKPGSREDERDPSNCAPLYDQALALARAIEELLESASRETTGAEGFGVRLSEAMTRSLIDQLAELKRIQPA